MSAAGRVALVGSGAGDPGLLTRRAETLLAEADLVLAHPAVPDAVLNLAGPRAEVLRSADEPVGAQLLNAARAGRQVVRLLPGDPFATPAGVKEAETVVRGGQQLEVVPSVPVADAVAAYAGLPLGPVRTVAEVTDGTDWRALASRGGTLVLLAPVAEVPKIGSALVEHGRRPEAPVAVTVGGTGPDQQTVVSTLDALETDVAGLSGDAVVVLGDPVKKVGRLGWYEQRALYGWRVLVPRTRDQAGVLSDALRRHGAIPVEVPTIAVEPPRTAAPMDRAIRGLVTGRYAWVAFTSTNAVRAVREKITELGLDSRAYAGVKIAAVGEATAASLRELGLEPDLLPSHQHSSEGLLADWAARDEVYDPLDRVLLPRADIATDTLLAGLLHRGWQVDEVTAYRTVRAAPPSAEIRDALKGGGFDAVLFTSSSTVRNLVGIAGKPHESTVLAAIGPRTQATAVEHGLAVAVLAEQAEIGSLVEALAAHALLRREQGLELPSAPRRRRLARGSR